MKCKALILVKYEVTLSNQEQGSFYFTVGDKLNVSFNSPGFSHVESPSKFQD